jgi:hypothetical protein
MHKRDLLKGVLIPTVDLREVVRADIIIVIINIVASAPL